MQRSPIKLTVVERAPDFGQVGLQLCEVGPQLGTACKRRWGPVRLACCRFGEKDDTSGQLAVDVPARADTLA